jgi:translation initiation factor 4G
MGDNITPELLLQYRKCNLEYPIELSKYIDYKKKIRDMDLFWKRDFQSKSTWSLKTKLSHTENEKLYSDINDLLNKLNKKNFDLICDSITQLQITCREHMIELVKRIIEEAMLNHLFINIYAKACSILMPYYIMEGNEKVHFRDVLLSRCQETFELYVKTKDDTDKKELIGIIKFIGELYNVNVLITSVIFMCFVTLYTNVMSNKPNSVEAICILMTVVGKDFFQKDNIKAKSCYLKIEELLKNGNIISKEKFMIMDLQELKEKEKW